MVWHFGAENDLIAPEHNFFGKTINIIFMNLLVPFIVQNFKKIVTADPELYDDTLFLGLKWTNCPE